MDKIVSEGQRLISIVALFADGFERGLRALTGGLDPLAQQVFALEEIAKDNARTLLDTIEDIREAVDILAPVIPDQADFQTKNVEVITTKHGQGDNTFFTTEVITTFTDDVAAFEAAMARAAPVLAKFNEQQALAEQKLRDMALAALGLGKASDIKPLKGAALALESIRISFAALQPVLEEVGLVNGGSFASFEARQPAKIGIFISQALTVAAVLELLVKGVSAYWGFAGDGRLRIGTISDPKGRKGELVGIDEILSIRRLNLPYKRPAFRISVGFRRNWTPNAGTLATAASKKQFRQSAIRIADAEDRTIKLRNLLAIDPPPIESHFVERSDAKAEAQRLLEIYGEMRVLYRIAIKTRGFTKDFGDIITIQHPRWGLAAGKPFLIVGIRCDTGRNRAELTCFG